MRSPTPALVPALCVMAGAGLAALGSSSGVGGPSELVKVPLGAVLVALGLGLGGGFGRACCCLGAGALAVWSLPADRRCFDRLAPGRPVEVVGELSEPWRSSGFGWGGALRARRVRQGSRVERCDELLRLSASGETEPDAAGRVRLKGFLKRTGGHRNSTDRVPARSPPRLSRLHLKSDRLWSREPAAGAGPLGLGALRRTGARARRWLDASFRGFTEREGMAAARALVLGDPRSMSEHTRRTLRRFGLSHLFAVSGLHVGLVAMLVHGLLRPLPQRARVAVAGVAVLAYLLVIGARSSIVRATTMLLLASFAVALDRPPHARQSLCLAAAGLVLLDPDLLSDLGFQLTVSASAGILWLAPCLTERWAEGRAVRSAGAVLGHGARLAHGVRSGLAATLGAQLASLPWAVPAFAMVHPLAPILNLVAIPWMVCFGIASFVGALWIRAVPVHARGVAATLDWGIRPLEWLERLPASPLWTFPTAMTVRDGLGVSVCLAVALVSRRKALRFACLLVALWLIRGPGLEETAELVVLDVGQGDAILLHDGRRTVLVDGGGWRRGDLAARVTVPALARLGVRRLDAVVISHSDVDHCRGVADLSAYLPIGRVLTGPGQARSPCVVELTGRARTRWRTVWRGERIDIGRVGLEVLHPAAGSVTRGNNASLVVRASVAASSILLTGDIEASAEARLLGMLGVLGPDALNSRILKVAHHGSRTSTTDRFLDAVAPRLAVISAGRDNRYGHPAPDVVDRLVRHRIRVLRTDRDGMVRLRLEPRVGLPGSEPP